MGSSRYTRYCLYITLCLFLFAGIAAAVSIHYYGSLTIPDDKHLHLGGAASIGIQADKTNEQLVWWPGTGSLHTISIGDTDNKGKDYDHGFTKPALYVHGLIDPDTSNKDWFTSFAGTGTGYGILQNGTVGGGIEVENLMVLWNTDSPPACTTVANQSGKAYYDSSMNELCFCDISGPQYVQWDGGGNCT